MFERYTEKARRIIFFARYESSQFGSPYIETEHLLLGLLREDKALTHRFLKNTQPERIRQQIEAATTKREKVSTSVDLPLSNENRRVLAYAAEEADRLSNRYIGPEHLLLGLLREEKSFAAQLLNEHGVRLSAVREQLGKQPHEPGLTAAPSQGQTLRPLSNVELTQLAREGQLRPFVGRKKELERLIHVLGRSTKNNAVLVGEPGVGKRAIVEGLAQSIVEGDVASRLAQQAIVALEMSFFRPSQGSGPVLPLEQNTIFFMDELHSLLAATPTGGAPGPSEILKPALLGGKIQCICAATPEEYRKARENHRWLDRCFRAIDVPPMNEAEAVEVLLSAKSHFEKFHSVTYTDDAIQHAVRYSSVYVKDRQLPDKALDLIDEAAAYVNARPGHLPEEVIEVRKRMKFIVKRLEDAIVNHEFAKARFYSDEELKERENLRVLLKKHNLDETTGNPVTREDVEEVLARWTGIPVSTIRAGQDAGPEAPEK
ncbi:MAG TPA: Clp protease N-terminal domain-containing protein [Candidatus Angelobacter sp.]